MQNHQNHLKISNPLENNNLIRRNEDSKGSYATKQHKININHKVSSDTD